MPELPEVETTKRGITPHIENQVISEITVRNGNLRYPVPSDELKKNLIGCSIDNVTRRGKYLLLHSVNGTMICHLGMSGSLRVITSETENELKKHDHIDIIFGNGKTLRYHDPRRFGLLLWHQGDPNQHLLISKMGPEPLTEEFNGDYLFKASRKRAVSIKQFIMNAEIVVGVGNIYASESLFMAGIKPTRPAGKVSRARYQTLCEKIKFVLDRSIQQGGTTLKDFVNSDGNPGYFAQQLNVYGLKEQPCRQCGAKIKHIVQGQRATFFCNQCQT